MERVRDLPHLGLYRRGTAAALVAAPALFLLDNLIHPREYERDREADQLAGIADAYTRWQAAHLLSFTSIFLFAAALLGLAFLVRRRRPGVGLVAGALGLAGLVGLAAVNAIDGYSWGIVGEVSTRRSADPATAQLVLHDLQQSDWSLAYYATPLGWIVGMAVLAVNAARQGAVPLWAGALLALGAVMVGLEVAIPSNAYFITSAAVLLVGGAGAARAVAGMSDDAYAAGGPATGSADASAPGPA